MNLDERIEALVQSVELLAAMHKDNEAKFTQRMSALDAQMGRTDKQIRRLGRYIHSIGTLVLDHDLRLRQLEGEDDEEQNDDSTQ